MNRRPEQAWDPNGYMIPGSDVMCTVGFIKSDSAFRRRRETSGLDVNYEIMNLIFNNGVYHDKFYGISSPGSPGHFS